MFDILTDSFTNAIKKIRFHDGRTADVRSECFRGDFR